jgi:hypothetical protein
MYDELEVMGIADYSKAQSQNSAEDTKERHEKGHQLEK